MSFRNVEKALKEMQSTLHPPFRVGQIAWNLVAKQYCLVVGLWEADSTDSEPGWEIVVRFPSRPEVNGCYYAHDLSPTPPEHDPTFPYEQEGDQIITTDPS